MMRADLSLRRQSPPADASDRPARVTKRSPTSALGRLWDRPGRFAAVAFVVLSLVPFLAFLAIGSAQGTLWLPGEANGVFEDPIFLSYFPVAVLGVVGVRYALERQYATINSLREYRLLRFEDDTDYLQGDYAPFASTLTPAAYEELIDFYDALLAAYTFRGDADAVQCPDAYRPIARRLRYLHGVLAVGGLVALAIGTYYHWFAVETYGFDIWASSNYLVGFAARFVYEAVLYVLVVPYLLTQLVVSLLLVYHPLKRLNETNGLRYERYAPDEAGGLSAFGIQSFTNVFALMPFVLPIAMYTLFYPTTGFLVAGLVLYMLAVPVIFLGQLWSAHRAMARMHAVELDIVGEALSQHYHLYKRRLVAADSMADLDDETLVTQGEALEKADIVYDGMQKQTTWPFGRTQIGQVLSLMTFIVGLIVSML